MRLGYGTQGKQVVLWTNYVEMTPRKTAVFHLYHIHVRKISDQKDEKKLAGKKLERLVKLFLLAPHMAKFEANIGTDYRTRVVANEELDSSIEGRERIQYLAENADDSPLDHGSAKSPEVFELWLDRFSPLLSDDQRDKMSSADLQILATNTLDLSTLMTSLKSVDKEYLKVNKGPFAQTLNIILNHFVKSNMGFVAIGKNKSFRLDPGPGDAEAWGNGLRAIRGFYSSVRPMTGRILVNIIVSNGVFYEPCPLTTTYDNFRRFHDDDILKFHKFLRMVRVQATHIKPKKQTNKQTRRTNCKSQNDYWPGNCQRWMEKRWETYCKG
jgi:eukaryotic translation initiation factor 2C